MPKVDIPQSLFTAYMGRKLDETDLEMVLPVAKAELDSIDEGRHLLRIELNDTNRPDLWSVAGIARQLKSYINGKPYAYDFFSTDSKTIESENRRIIVHPSLKDIRPYIAAFAAEGKPIDDLFLQTLIQSQEKLCANYGRKRKTVAMGIYPVEKIEFPVYYRGADPESTYFCPLDAATDMSLTEIIDKHPKGIEYGHIISKYNQFPYLEDNAGKGLSFPPIINSRDCGEVSVGDKHFFIELTGTDIHSVLTSTAIIACDLADTGYRILPIKIVYPYDTPYGREMVTPYYFQKPCSVAIEDISKILGKPFSEKEIADCLEKMGHHVVIKDGIVSISIPPYRNDFMHGVDIIEEIMIGHGIDSFDPILPEDATIGRLSSTEEISRKARDIMIGLGYQEMMFNYLGSKEDIVDKMVIAGENVVEIANPKSQSYRMIRNSILPNLLHSEAVSANALYPHQIFEIGSVVQKESGNDLTTATKHYIGILMADRVAGFNEINAHISALLYYMNLEYTLKPIEDSRFIHGRCAAVLINDQPFGILGELHPVVLENWHIEMPCAVAEMDISAFLNTEGT